MEAAAAADLTAGAIITVDSVMEVTIMVAEAAVTEVEEAGLEVEADLEVVIVSEAGTEVVEAVEDGIVEGIDFNLFY